VQLASEHVPQEPVDPERVPLRIERCHEHASIRHIRETLCRARFIGDRLRERAGHDLKVRRPDEHRPGRWLELVEELAAQVVLGELSAASAMGGRS
jgi:hypothetical protein